jgi:CRISPR/Cas system-associated exonuclease Cas4 (RecB family)
MAACLAWLLSGSWKARCVDLAIATPSREAPDAEGIVVEYKLSEQKAGAHFKLQLAAYALLLEEAWGMLVKRGFLYSIPLRKAELVPITAHLRKKVLQTVTQIRQISRAGGDAATLCRAISLCNLRVSAFLQ